MSHAHFDLELYEQKRFGMWHGSQSLLENCGERDPGIASAVMVAAFCRVVHEGRAS